MDTEVTLGGELVALIPPEPSRKLELRRDRIALEFTSDRAIIKRVYPMEGDLDRLVEVAGYAVKHTELEKGMLVEFGYNIELVYEQDSGLSSLRYIGDRLFAGKEFGSSGWKFLGGAGRIFFNSSDGFWTVQLEPRFNDSGTSRVFFRANLHKAKQSFPSSEKMLQSLKDLWEQAHDFIKRLDGSP